MFQLSFYAPIALLQTGLPKEGYPLWLVISLALLAGIAAFFEKIKSTIELRILGKQKREERQFLALEKENAELKNRLDALEIQCQKDKSLLEKKITRLLLSETKLATVAMFLLTEYEKTNPDNTEIIERMKIMIKNANDGNPTNET